ncbi:MAG: 2-oxoglutarate dehydrogenase complex dihydrolipoyllysine-residue succinyltransferase [Acidobacteria bacterium]|nr:2-oxoglutarate dehydrogenase complex dihydrolipoyllysine-residue succinyltransferase [Acidobacteriota bacterium]
MAMKIIVPELGESVIEATVGRWLKREGDRVAVGEAMVELETEKVNLEVGAERAGVLARIERKEGENVKIGDVLGVIEEVAGGVEAVHAAPQAPGMPREAAVAIEGPAGVAGEERGKATPVAKHLASRHGVDLAEVPGSGPGGRVTKQDVQSYLESQKVEPEITAAPPAEREAAPAPLVPPVDRLRREERVRMSRRRQTIARRLVEAQRTAAMLTTFNEVDMSAVMEIRKRRRDSFKERHGIGLGIMSFFVKATIGSLKAFPRLNAEIQGDEMVLKHYYDIGIAIGASEGLVVPVLRDADRMSFAEIEKAIKEYVQKADDGTLSLEDLRGGTFTITNGGVYGSLLSTPILNPPQVGILAMHKIEERPTVLNGTVVIRPMMYVALSYDHRIVDGRESVQFLVKVKDLIEDPAALLLEG